MTVAELLAVRPPAGVDGVCVRYYLLSLGLIALWVAWLTWILVYGGVDWPTDAEKAGQFGDAFGAVASLMATLAAVGVYLTYRQDRKSREEQEFEDNFFRLLKNFELITKNVQAIHYSVKKSDIKNSKWKYEKLAKLSVRKVLDTHDDQVAIRVILYKIRENLNISDFRDSKKVHFVYQSVYSEHSDGLGNYFRTLYHIFRLIDEDALRIR